jgi:glycosyltransferase involved in cell wall biosynthesis
VVNPANPEDSIQGAISANMAQARFVPDRNVAYDVVFVVNVSSRGWILEKICRVIAEQSGMHWTIIYTERSDRVTAPLPLARAYFFSHYKLYVGSLARHPQISSAQRFIWFTHPDFEKFTAEDVSFALGHATGVFTANAAHREFLITLGVAPSRIHTVLGGASPESFRTKIRGQGAIGFVGAYYERKNPKLMLEVMRRMPEHRFILLGPSPSEVENHALLWANSPMHRELSALSNLELVEAKYADYPAFYDRMDVYVSLSKLEGGPIPLIEAMFANAVPVVTRTGFAEDIVRDGQNGWLLDLECSVTDVVSRIENAVADQITDIRTTAQGLSWAAFGRTIAAHFLPKLQATAHIDFAQLDNCARFMREGWNRREHRGCAMEGKRARLHLPMASPAMGVLKLRFKLKTVQGLERISVAVVVNGRVAHRETLPVGQVHTLTCHGPFAEAHGDAQSVWLELEADDANLRPLLRLEGVSIEPLSKPDQGSASRLAPTTPNSAA